MELHPDSKLLEDLSPDTFVKYLDLTGWKLSTSSNKKWMIFEGASDYYGNPLEIVIPQDSEAPDISTYISNAVNLLSALHQTDPELLVHNIRYHDRDILRIRNIETGDTSSISLRTAAAQVPQLKHLVSYAACSEVEPLPIHANTRKPIAKQMVSQYRFGHTFRGSFGFTVEAPIPGPSITQNELLKGVKYLPVERRVMERIVRGLSHAKLAVEARDTKPIIDNYADGLNANMCRSLLGLSVDKSSPIEFSITWSPKVAPSDDISNPEPIVLSEASYKHIEYAASQLEQMKLKEVTIRGLVKALKVDDNPLGLDTSRMVVIQVTNESDSLPSQVNVLLSKEDYQKAIIAHGEWTPIIIKGILQVRRGNRWHLINYTSFDVTPKLF
jgi:hypothetical protein